MALNVIPKYTAQAMNIQSLKDKFGIFMAIAIFSLITHKKTCNIIIVFRLASNL